MYRRICLGIFILTMLPALVQAAPASVRAINILSANIENGHAAIDAAAAEGMTQVQLSHRVIHNLFDLKDDQKLALAGELSSYAHSKGISEVLVWDHALYDTDYYPAEFYYPGTGLLDLDKEGLWEWIRQDYRGMMALCPDVDGLVLTFVESGARIEEQYSRMSIPERLAKVINTVSGVVCEECGKTLYLRTFAYDEAEYRNIEECFSLVDWNGSMVLMVKDAPHDFFLFHPDNSYAGKLGHPTVVEFDTCLEYGGQAEILGSIPDYFYDRWRRMSILPEVCGFVARTSRCEDDEITGTPSEVNLYTLNRISDNPDAALDEIVSDFVSSRYGEAAVKYLKPALMCGRDVVEGTMYILGLSTSHHSNFTLEAPSTYSRHVSGRWTSSEYFRPGHGVDRELHWWKDIVNKLAPVSCKTGLDPKRAAEIAYAFENGWLSGEEEMDGQYLDYVIRWVKDCRKNTMKGFRKLKRGEKVLSECGYNQLYDLFERSLMCLDLRGDAAVCYWGSRIWSRGEGYRTGSLRRKVDRAAARLEKTLESYENYDKVFPKGTWDWCADTLKAREYLELALSMKAGD